MHEEFTKEVKGVGEYVATGTVAKRKDRCLQ